MEATTIVNQYFVNKHNVEIPLNSIRSQPRLKNLFQSPTIGLLEETVINQSQSLLSLSHTRSRTNTYAHTQTHMLAHKHTHTSLRHSSNAAEPHLPALSLSLPAVGEKQQFSSSVVKEKMDRRSEPIRGAADPTDIDRQRSNVWPSFRLYSGESHHTHSLSVSSSTRNTSTLTPQAALSLSLSHTHTHTVGAGSKKAERERIKRDYGSAEKHSPPLCICLHPPSKHTVTCWVYTCTTYIYLNVCMSERIS